MKYRDEYSDNQRSRDWRIERLGSFTGSRIGDLMKSGRKKDETFGETAKSYIYEIMAERMISSKVLANDEMWQQYLSLTTSTSKAMQFGTDNEADALSSFEQWVKMSPNDVSPIRVVRTGSISHFSIPNFSASPDSVIVDEDDEIVACVETKVPLPKTFMQYKMEVVDAESLKAVNPQYYYQVHAEMMVTDTTLCYFCAYQPFLNKGLHVACIERNESTVEAIRERLEAAEQIIRRNG